MDETQRLVARINALAARSPRSRTTLSRILFGNGKRLDEIEAGGSVTMATFQRAEAMLSDMERAYPSSQERAA